MHDKIKMFATNNPTDKWAVAVDGFFGFFASEEAAESVYRLAAGDSNSIDCGSTPFGSMCIIPPKYKCEWAFDDHPLEMDIREVKPINIKQYIIKKRKGEN